MKSAIVTDKAGKRETGETVIFVEPKEVGLILSALELYRASHKRSKLCVELIGEFEMIPCQQPKLRTPTPPQ